MYLLHKGGMGHLGCRMWEAYYLDFTSVYKSVPGPVNIAFLDDTLLLLRRYARGVHWFRARR